jgi:hypothetical protein
MLIDLNYEDSKHCLLWHEDEYMHCAWDMGGKVIAVEYIPCNWPSLTLCTWPSLADWWHAVENVPWLQDDLLRLAVELVNDPAADPQIKALANQFQREQEDEDGDFGEDDDLGKSDFGDAPPKPR